VETRPVLRIFISSTAVDLRDYRDKVRDAVLRLEDLPIAMKTFSAQSGQPASECMKMAAQADAVICIVAHRYGYVPPKELGGDGERSITWLEVDAAKRAGKPVFAFLVDPKAPWTELREESRLTSEPEKAAEIFKAVQKLQEFKAYLSSEYTRGTFSGDEELAKLAAIAVANFVRQPGHGVAPKRPAKGRQFSSRSVRLSHRLLQLYLAAEIGRHASVQLPLTSQGGQPLIAPISDLPIDLPLIVSHRHAPIDQHTKAPWINREVDSINDQFRSAVLFGRESRDEGIRPDTDIAQELRPSSRVVIVGDPGCGKSTLLQSIAHHYASLLTRGPEVEGASIRSIQSLPVNDWLPIMVLCDDLSGQPLPNRLDALLRIHLKRRQFSDATSRALAFHFERLLEQGRAILLFDGLDEIPGSARRIQFCRLLIAIASRFPESPILVTSRVVGFPAVSSELAVKYDHLLVSPLGRQAKQTFIERWSSLIGLAETETASVVQQVCFGRHTAHLTNNVLLLAMVAQIKVLNQKDRRDDVYRRAVQLMIQRCRAFSGTPLSTNELIPHLEFLAYRMRKKSLLRCSEKEVVVAFRELRRREADESVLRTRRPEGLLRACIDSVNLLNVAGTETDQRGYDRRMIQFSHQQFQEYFAAQAVNHGRDDSGQEGPLARLRSLWGTIKTHEREVSIRDGYKIAEFVLDAEWQETIRMAIAGLNPEAADDAILMLLPDSTTPPHEARARVVFALRCLAYEPRVSEQTALAVCDAVIDCIQEGDGFNSEPHTWMDEALAATAESAFRIPIRDRLIEGFIANRGDKRRHIGSCLTLRSTDDDSAVSLENADALITFARHGLSSQKQTERVRTALELMNRFFLTDGRLGFLEPNQRDSLSEILMTALFKDEATVCAAMWALAWLTGASRRTPGNRLAESSKPKPTVDMIHLDPPKIRQIENILQTPGLDATTLGYGCLVLTTEIGLNPVVQQLDWMYELAVIADGVKPRRRLPTPGPTGHLASTGWLKDMMINRPAGVSCRIAQALGSFGVYLSEMVRPLQFVFQNPKYHNDDRDEALLYLALVGAPDAIDTIIEAADTPPCEKEDYLYSRGLFGLLLLDNVDILAGQIRKALAHSDPDAYAYGLAGSRDPRGRALLDQLKDDTNPRVRKAVEKAFARPWMSSQSMAPESER
jgi:energy-coupling factor transporter ATP-binding protein EcfA2